MKKLLTFSFIFALISESTYAITFKNEWGETVDVIIHGIEPRNKPNGDLTMTVASGKPGSEPTVKLMKQDNIALMIEKGETSLKFSYKYLDAPTISCTPEIALSKDTNAETVDKNTTVTITRGGTCTVTQ